MNPLYPMSTMNPPEPPAPPFPLPSPLPPLVPSVVPSPGSLPVGAIIAYAGVPHSAAPAPEGFLVCDGRALDKDDFHELFQVIGYKYSRNDGGQRFQLPNLQGYFLRGVDPRGSVDKDRDQRVSVAGAAYDGVGSIQQSAFQLHEHELSAATAAAAKSPSGTEAGTVTTVSEKTTEVVPEAADVPLHTSKFESRPVNVAVYFLVLARSARELRPAALAESR
jgi:microcystin-dependent protein